MAKDNKQPKIDDFPPEIYYVREPDVEHPEAGDQVALTLEELSELDELEEAGGWFAVYEFKGFRRLKKTLEIVSDVTPAD